MGFSSRGSLALEHRLSRCGHGLSCFEAHGIFLDQGLNPCLLQWQVDSLSLSHQGIPAGLIWSQKGAGHEKSEENLWGFPPPSSTPLRPVTLKSRPSCKALRYKDPQGLCSHSTCPSWESQCEAHFRSTYKLLIEYSCQNIGHFPSVSQPYLPWVRLANTVASKTKPLPLGNWQEVSTHKHRNKQEFQKVTEVKEIDPSYCIEARVEVVEAVRRGQLATQVRWRPWCLSHDLNHKKPAVRLREQF